MTFHNVLYNSEKERSLVERNQLRSYGIIKEGDRIVAWLVVMTEGITAANILLSVCHVTKPVYSFMKNI